MDEGATARHAIAAAARRFAFSDTARLDAELLMAFAMGVTREEVLLCHLDDAIPAGFAALVERRAGQEPVAYIVGRRAFWTIEIDVAPGALVPRADSETLIEAAVDYFGTGAGPRRVLDLGTGPGTLLLAALAEWPAATGVGIDRSVIALDQANRNALRLGMGVRAVFRPGDWAAGMGERFDLILANPPYIAENEVLADEVRLYEPAEALFAGADGLDDYRAIAPQLPGLIAPGGVAVIEIGWMQADAVGELIAAQGLSTTLRCDVGSRARCIVATA